MKNINYWHFSLFIALFLCFTKFSLGQQERVIKIKLNEVPVDSAIATPVDVLVPIKDIKNIKNIPKRHHITSLRVLIINDSKWYENYKMGWDINNDWYKYDHSNISSEPIKGKAFAVFISLDTIKNIKYFAIDQNRNLDFSDDLVMEQKMDSISNYSSFAVQLQAKFEFFGGKLKDYTIPIKIYPFQSKLFNDDEVSNKLGISVAYNKGMKGTFDTDRYTYMFISNIPNFSIYSGHDYSLAMITLNKKGMPIDYTRFQIGDTITISNRAYSVEEINLSLKYLKLRFIKYEMYGSTVGMKLQNFHFTDFITQDSIGVTSGNQNFLLLDFWGTWCLPCLKGIPKLKELVQNNNDKLKIISFAFDQSKDTALLRKIIIQNKMNWNHVWVDRNTLSSNDINKKLNIMSYPSFLLIDSTNTIIYRGIGEDALNEIKKILE